MQIPSIDLNLAFVQGDSVALLRGGPGHAAGTPLPGHIGNAVVFGHRKGWGGPFGRLGQLQPGATIDVRLNSSTQVLLFAVTSVTRVADDGKLLAPSTDRRLTLVTSDQGRIGTGYTVVTAVSGPLGKLKSPGRATPAPSRGSVLFDRQNGLLVLRIAAAAMVVALLRRRYRPGIVVAVASPLVLSALLVLLLDVDRLFAPLG